MSTLSVVVHFIVGILFYIAYAILITQILRYRKTIEELKTPFYSAVVISGIVDCLSHFVQVPCYVIGLYPGFASIAAQFSDNFTWHWTPVYALQYYFTSCQFALGFYLSFIRLVMVLFTVSGPTWIQKTFRYFIATIFIISAFPTFYLFGSRTRFFKLDLRMTNQVQTYFLAYEPWIKGTSNALNCIIFFSIFIILSIATSVGTIIKLIRLKKETKVFKISEKTKVTTGLKFMIFICITSFIQFLHLIINLYFNFATATISDPSLYYIALSLKAWMCNLLFCFLPISLLILSKKIRQLFFLFGKSTKKVVVPKVRSVVQNNTNPALSLR